MLYNKYFSSCSYIFIALITYLILIGYAFAADDLLNPPLQNTPLEVTASFYLQDINNINDEEENFDFSGVLTLTWLDPRQAFDAKDSGLNYKIYQGSFQFDEISPAWYPQVIIRNNSGGFETDAVILKIMPDGTCILTQTIIANAEVDLNMRKHPFDSQILDILFEMPGTESNFIKFKPDPRGSVSWDKNLEIAQWHFKKLMSIVDEINTPYAGLSGKTSVLKISALIDRQSFFMIRLIFIPLIMIVILSWCVFWMDRSSLGDRINVSFIGILTAVAYQNVVSDILPHISYMTLTNAFVNISFFLMSATIVVNLLVGEYDKKGMSKKGDLIDKRCRIIFPAAYVILLLLAVLITYTIY